MSKRNKRKERRARASVAQFGPIEVKRTAKSVSYRNTMGPLSEKQRVKAEKELKQGAADALSAFQQETAKIEALLAKYDPFTVIALMILRESIVNPDTYKEYSFTGQVINVEHIALLAAKSSYPSNASIAIDVSDVGRVFEYVDQIKTLFFFKYDQNSRSETHVGILAWFASVRMPAYEHQYLTMLGELFSPFDTELSASLGFSSRDILLLEQAYSQIANDYVNVVRKVAIEESEAIRAAVTGGPTPPHVPQSFLDDLKALSPSNRETVLREMRYLWSAKVLGEQLAMTAASLATSTGLDAKTVLSALSFFSITFGDVPKAYDFPEPYSILQRRPFLEHNGHFLRVSAGLLLPAIQPMLEHAMNPARTSTANASVWNAYTEHRKALSEGKALEYLGRAFSGASIYDGVHYRDAGTRYELDGLILFDRTLLFVEVKAGAFSPQAKSGDADAFLGDIDKLINEAHRQAQRALDYYMSAAQPAFEESDGSKIPIDRRSYDRILLITVTMEQLGILMADFNRIPNRDPSREVPCGLSLWDLDAITQFIGNGAELLDYLVRRTQISTRFENMRAPDELDWLGRYFHDSLEFADLGRQAAQYTDVSVSAGTTQMDEYFLFAQGLRETKVDKPAHKIEPIIRAVIDDLQRTGKPGWSEVALVLLGLPHKIRRSFRKHAEKAQNRKVDRTFRLDHVERGIEIACSFESSLRRTTSSADTRLDLRLRDDASVAEVLLERKEHDPIQFVT